MNFWSRWPPWAALRPLGRSVCARCLHGRGAGCQAGVQAARQPATAGADVAAQADRLIPLAALTPLGPVLLKVNFDRGLKPLRRSHGARLVDPMNAEHRRREATSSSRQHDANRGNAPYGVSSFRRWGRRDAKTIRPLPLAPCGPQGKPLRGRLKTAPLQPAGFAVAGPGRGGEGKRMTRA